MGKKKSAGAMDGAASVHGAGGNLFADSGGLPDDFFVDGAGAVVIAGGFQ